MDPKFQSSFIPKGPIVSTSSKSAALSASAGSVKTSINFLPSLATLLFVLALVAWGGLWGYGHYLQSQVTASENSLTTIQAAFDPQTTNSLLLASQRIQVAQNLVQNHVALSNLFNLLQQSILPTVSFTTFTFTSGSDGSIDFSVDGVASSYASLAEQSQILNSLPYLTAPSFDNLALSDQGGVTWKFSAQLSPSAISYVSSMQSQTGTETQASSTVPVVSSATSTTP